MREAGIPRALALSWEWLEYAARLPANPQPVAGITAGTLIYGGRCILTGGWLQNNGVGSGGVNVLDGLDASGTLVVIQPLAAQAVIPIALPSNGVVMELGVYLQPTTATIRGSLYVIPLFHYPFTGPGE